MTPTFGCSLPGVCGLPGIGSSVSKGVADAVLAAVSAAVAQAGSWLVHQVVGLLAPSVRIRLDLPWFLTRMHAMGEVVLLLCGPILMAATIGAVLRQDARRLVRVWAVGVPVGLVVGGAAVPLTDWALGLVDRLCGVIAPGGSFPDFERIAARLAGPTVPSFVQFVIGGLVVLAAIALWFELVLRSTAIYLAVFFFPLALACFIWPATAHVAKRFVEVLVALIGSKFVIVATLTVGAAAADARPGSIDDAVTAASVLLLAAFAPFAVLRLLPVVEIAAVGHLEGMARRPARVATHAAGMAAAPAVNLAGRLGQAPGAGMTTTAVGATAIPEMAGDWSLPPRAGAEEEAGHG